MKRLNRRDKGSQINKQDNETTEQHCAPLEMLLKEVLIKHVEEYDLLIHIESLAAQ